MRLSDLIGTASNTVFLLVWLPAGIIAWVCCFLLVSDKAGQHSINPKHCPFVLIPSFASGIIALIASGLIAFACKRLCAKNGIKVTRIVICSDGLSMLVAQLYQRAL